MSGLFPSSSAPAQEIPKPKATRMPYTDDPEILEAARRTREAALMRKGRMSTILTDQTKDTVGSSGQKLGA